MRQLTLPGVAVQQCYTVVRPSAGVCYPRRVGTRGSVGRSFSVALGAVGLLGVLAHAGCSSQRTPTSGTPDRANGSSDAAVSTEAGPPPECASCEDETERRIVASNATAPVTFPACCAQTPSGPACGLVYSSLGCQARDQPGSDSAACPDGCCRVDGTCGVKWPSLGCAKGTGPPLSCRAAEGPYPGQCACGHCAAEIDACNQSVPCAEMIARRRNGGGDDPVDPEVVALAGKLDDCLSAAGCDPMNQPGRCKEPCPESLAGGHLVLVTLPGCCSSDGMCGVVYGGECTSYGSFELARFPHDAPSGPLSCVGASLARPDDCACRACKKEIMACIGDPSCVTDPSAEGARAVEECLSRAGCKAGQLGYC